MSRGSGPAQHFLISLQYVTPRHTHTRLICFSEVKPDTSAPGLGAPCCHSTPGTLGREDGRGLRKGSGHFLGACAQTATQAPMPSSSSTAWVAASPPPLPAGMTLCGHAGVTACVSMSAWQPGSCASVQPGSEGETCSTLHKKCKCRCSGPPGPGGSRCCCCISPIPLARGGRAAKPAAL